MDHFDLVKIVPTVQKLAEKLLPTRPRPLLPSASCHRTSSWNPIQSISSSLQLTPTRRTSSTSLSTSSQTRLRRRSPSVSLPLVSPAWKLCGHSAESSRVHTHLLDHQKAYRKLALLHHPDKHATKDEAGKEEESKLFQRVGFAYGVLRDEGRRKRCAHSSDQK